MSSSDSSTPNNGREQAIEALLDLNPKGPLFRFGRIMNEAPGAALSSRPNLITRSALVDVAKSLSQHEISDGYYLSHQHTAPPTSENNIKKHVGNSLQNAAVATTTTTTTTGNNTTAPSTASKELFPSTPYTTNKTSNDDPIQERKNRDRIMRHHSKVVIAKSKANANNSSNSETSTKPLQQGKASSTTSTTTTTSMNASPPPQLVAALRKIYGTSSSDDLRSLEYVSDQDGKASTTSGSSSTSSLLPSLLRSVLNHPIFSSTSKKEDVKVTTTPSTSSNDDGGESGTMDEGSKDVSQNTDDKVNDDTTPKELDTNTKSSSEKASIVTNMDYSWNDTTDSSSLANIELIVGNACLMQSQSIDNNEALQGLLIAALSVLTNCITKSEGDNDFGEDEPISRVGRNESMGENISLQVGGPVSLLSKQFEDSVTKCYQDTNLILDPAFTNYLNQAAVTYEERIEIQKERILRSREDKTNSTSDDASKGTSEAGGAKVEIVDRPKTPPCNESLAIESTNTAMRIEVVGHHTEEMDVDTPAGSRLLVDSPHTPHTPLLSPERILPHRDHDDTNSSGDEDEDSDEDEEYSETTSEYNENRAVVLERVEDESAFGRDEEDSSLHSSSSSQENSDEEEEEEEEDDDEGGDEEEEKENDDTEGENDVQDENEADLLARALLMSLTASRLNDVEGGGETNNGSDNQVSDDNSRSANEHENNEGADESNDADRVQDDERIESEKEEHLESDDVTANVPITPVTSNLIQDTADTKKSDEEQEMDLLPQMPAHPSTSIFQHLFDGAFYKTSRLDQTKDSHGHDDLYAPFLDPASLSNFGSIPAPHALVRLLLSATQILEEQISTTQTIKGVSADKQVSSQSTYDGGVASRLFPPLTKEDGENSVSKGIQQFLDKLSPDTKQGELKTSMGQALHPKSTILNLLVVILSILTSTRDEVLNELSRYQKELYTVMTEEHEQPDDVPDDAEKDIIDETDDPAFAVVGSQNPTSPQTYDRPASDSLEEKGMMRKAAAAAEDAVIRKGKIQQHVDLLHHHLKLSSLCCYITTKSLRYFLQALSTDEPKSAISVSPILRIRLSSSLATFTSSYNSRLCNDVLRNAPFTDTAINISQRDLLPMTLLFEGSALWGESVNILHPTQTQVEDQLCRLLKNCFPSSFDSDSRTTLDLTKPCNDFPWNDYQENFLKLEAMCARLCTGDVLERLVASPLKYDKNSTLDVTAKSIPILPSSILSMLCKVMLNLPSDISTPSLNVTKLYYALCNRCNSKLMLWDDFALTSNDIEDEDNTISNSYSLKGSANDSKTFLSSNSSFDFDTTKCAESIAITPASSNLRGPSANQRASKVWGTVLSTKCLSPKTGVHRWAVKLEKCERGHVFVGVATSRASTKTYVGGDKNGWGVIGTQALWHDRRKVRGDYGGTFRTGAIIIVTLDTDTGTLSFGVWNDHKNDRGKKESSGSEQMMSLTSPAASRSQKQRGGLLEDWGVAFEGLPLDVKLYPAVGLYQRDDRITILSVEKQLDGYPSLGELDGSTCVGHCYYPKETTIANEDMDTKQATDYAIIQKVQTWNRAFCDQGIVYASSMLNRTIELLSSETFDEKCHTNFFKNILPSVASSLSLYPSSIPHLSGACVMKLLPLVIKCASLLDTRISDKHHSVPIARPMKNGTWTIRATPSSSASSDDSEDLFEEYVVCLEHSGNDDFATGFHGKGVGITGRSKNGHVLIAGASNGTSLQFTEEWYDRETSKKDSVVSSSCVVDTRLNLDGSRFEGTYRNVQYGTTGVIAGIYDPNPLQNQHLNDSIKDLYAEMKSEHVHNSNEKVINEQQYDYVRSCSLLSHAANRLALILKSGAPLEDVNDLVNTTSPITRERKLQLFDLLGSSPVLSLGNAEVNMSKFDSSLKQIKTVFSTSEENNIQISPCPWEDDLRHHIGKGGEEDSELNKSELESIDQTVLAHTGGNGSLSTLDRPRYSQSRRNIIFSCLYHCDRLGESTSTINSSDEEISDVWKTALKIMESGIRNFLTESSNTNKRIACREFCEIVDSVSNLLLQLQCARLSWTVIKDDMENIYSTIICQKDVSFLKEVMELRTIQGVLRYSALNYINRTVGNLRTHSAIECIIGNLCSLTGCSSGKRLELNATKDIDRERLYSLNGCCSQIQMGIKSVSSDLFSNILEVISTVTDQLPFEGQSIPTSIQSLLLMTFSNFFIYLRRDRCSYVSDLKLWKVIRALFSKCHVILQRHSEREPLKNDTSLSEVGREILRSSSRHISLDILRCLVSFIHIILYQLTKNHTRIPSEKDDFASIIDSPISILKSSIDASLKYIKTQQGILQKKTRLEAGKDEFTKLADGTQESTDVKQEKHQVSLGRSIGTHYLISEGKAGIYSKSGSGSQGASEYFVATISTQDHFIVHLLNAFCSLLGSFKMYSGDVEKIDSKWVYSLMNNVFEDDNTFDSIPSKFRIRIIRMLRLALPSISPESSFVNQIFSHVGNLLNATSDSLQQSNNLQDEYLELKETISLLRHLYSSDKEKTKWNDVMSSIIMNSSSSDKLVQTGIRSFLGGLPGRITVGSYVLLKPSSAASLSKPLSSSFFTKSQSTSSGAGSSQNGYTPIIAGNGMEGIVAGLCRKDAMAGMISHIDVKNGACEVILCDRTIDDNDIDLGKSMYVTIRAVRVSLNDVVSAEENALLLDESISPKNIISSSFVDFSKSVDRAHQKEESVETYDDIISGILSLRSSTVLLSNSTLIGQYLRDESKDVIRESLSKVLETASCNVSNDSLPNATTASLEGLSALPDCEARFWYLQDMMSYISQRRTNLNTILVDDIQQLMTTETVGDSTSNLDTPPKKDNNDGDLQHEGYSTPPATVGAVSESLFSSEHDDSEAGRENQGTNSNSVETSNDEDENEEVDDEDEEEENAETEEESRLAEETEAAHLREAAIVQMAELGLPRSWSEYALRRVGGTNIEAAVHFCLERSGDMERLLTEEQEREARSSNSSSDAGGRRRNQTGPSGISHLMRQLVEMGFPAHWCAEALAATGHNVDEALTWILTNGERLGALDEGQGDEGDDDDDDDDDESTGEQDNQIGTEGNNEPDNQVSSSEKTEASSSIKVSHGSCPNEDESGLTKKTEQFIGGWKEGIVCPLRSISGRTKIDSRSLEVTGHPNGGFSSVGMKGIPLYSGKWYYEAVLITAGCLQIGWADSSFSGHCQADNGDGCGDGPSSWAYDGWRRYRWHSTPTEWGCRWNEGDVIGCLLDMDEKKISFTLNGRGEEIGMGLAFSGEGFRPCGGVYICVSFNRKEKIRLVLGNDNNSFYYPPPPGYRGVGESVQSVIRERDVLLSEEQIINVTDITTENDAKRYLCDFSDGEHGHELFSWQHRYYGSDASVHLGSSSRSLRNRHKDRRSLRSNDSGLSSRSSNPEDICASSINAILEKFRKDMKKNVNISEIDTEIFDEVLGNLNRMYENATFKILQDLVDNGLALMILYARKFIYHITVSLSTRFDLEFLTSHSVSKEETARQFWTVIEKCCSLHTAGWVGEAGAMALASEALGLGISSQEQNSRGENSSGNGILLINDGTRDSFALPTGKISQFLSTVKVSQNCLNGKVADPSAGVVACTEATLGGDGGGAIVFLRSALQNAIVQSNSLLQVIVAAVRRSVRQLASIEYGSDESSSEAGLIDDEESGDSDEAEQKDSNKENELKPDARLVSFLTGLLLDKQIYRLVVEKEGKQSVVAASLFEGWSVGLLSASAPWRMICALTAAGILNLYPDALHYSINRLPTLKNFYSKLSSIVARRMWAERASVPVCSKYVQAFIELLSSVKHSSQSPPDNLLLSSFENVAVDAATPIPIALESERKSWEWEENWVGNDDMWETLTGTVEFLAVDWTIPSRSAVRSLMDGGEGPPMLREGCTVIRGLDWDETGSGTISGNEDGKDLYDKEKALRDQEKKNNDEVNDTNTDKDQNDREEDREVPVEDPDRAEEVKQPSMTQADQSENDEKEEEKPQKKKKIPNPKLPVGRVLSIEPWKGIPGLARKVKWDLTGEEGIYRFGADGGRYDIAHVEVNDKLTRIRKRHPLPESAEQCASRYGFGIAHRYHIILRIRRHGKQICSSLEGDIDETIHEGILEWPDFGAGVQVECRFYDDGAIGVTEKKLLFGSKDSGWEARFGQPSFVSGSTIVLSTTNSPSSCTVKEDCEEEDGNDSSTSFYEELLGSSSYVVDKLRNRADGSKLRVTNEMRLLRCRHSKIDDNHVSQTLGGCCSLLPPPIYFDSKCHASSLKLSRDGRTVTCQSSDGRGTAYGSVGFTKGVHYWEVKIEQADIGSVFIGVAEKPSSNSNPGGSSSVNDMKARLNRWHGWGFVNFRATYSAGAERVYGAHCHAGDVVGVLLDCDAGRLSFFFDGVKYGEHILNDLGCAFENISPFGFNADGCGSGGAGNGAPNGGGDGLRSGRYLANGAVRPKALWPVIGLRHPGDRVTMTGKWMTTYSVDGVTSLQNTLKVDEVMSWYESSEASYPKDEHDQMSKLPRWLINDSFQEYEIWRNNKWSRCMTRGSAPHHSASPGLEIDVDTSLASCAIACACLGLKYVLLPGDRVSVKRSSGRLLELAEEAEIVGVYQGRLWYKLISQKSEGGSLSEGGDRAWFWDESEVVDSGLQLIGESRGQGVELPLLERFKCPSKGGLKVIYKGGAVVRSDLEIFDGSSNVGTIPSGTIIPQKDVLERRINSCGVVRYRVKYEGIDSGWISKRIRGGDEEAIVEPVLSSDSDDGVDNDKEKYYFPSECANRWLADYEEKVGKFSGDEVDRWSIANSEEFEKHLLSGTINGMSIRESDSFLASLVGSIADVTPQGDAVECSFDEILSSLVYGMKIHGLLNASDNTQELNLLMPQNFSGSHQEAAVSIFSKLTSGCPTVQSILARIAMLRSLNRRVSHALPWLSFRPPQESSAVLGGLAGFGASVERVGRSTRNNAMNTWSQVPSIGSRMRLCRSIIFPSVKRSFLDSVIYATTTPTSLSHDEYELPREVRTVRVNRLKARRSMSSKDSTSKKKHSVFSQLQSEIRGWSGAALRRGHVAKGHGGQKRAFKVKLIGEGVNDYSGPYREVFTDAIREVAEVDSNSESILDILQPTPNKSVGIGDDRDLFMFCSGDADTARHDGNSNILDQEEAIISDYYSSFMITKSERLREIEESVAFLGKISATALRHGILVDLSLPLGLVWKSLCEEESNSLENMKEIDMLGYRQLVEEKVDTNDVKSLIPQLQVQQRVLNSFADGMSSIVPLEILSMFSGKEIRDIFCGNPDVDVDLLKKVVEYEGFSEEDDVVSYFWETLREMTIEERKLFLQFVWARTRLPIKESDFEAPFKIQKDTKSKGESDALPTASTCFFTLSLPEYTDKDTLKKKLLFAIRNVTTMESDYVTNDAEVGEGWRGI